MLESNQFGWADQSAKSGSTGVPMSLLFALIDLAIELFRRFPGIHNPYLLSRWQASASRLAWAGTELLLWDKLRQYPMVLNRLGIALATAFDRGANLLAGQPQDFGGELRNGSLWAVEMAMYGVLGLRNPGWEFAPHPWFWRGSPAGDAADDLACDFILAYYADDFQLSNVYRGFLIESRWTQLRFDNLYAEYL